MKEKCRIIRVSNPHENTYLVVRSIKRPSPETLKALEDVAAAAKRYIQDLKDGSDR